jgi:hypothetical protein
LDQLLGGSNAIRIVDLSGHYANAEIGGIEDVLGRGEENDIAPGSGMYQHDQGSCREQHCVNDNEKSSQYVQDRNIPMRYFFRTTSRRRSAERLRFF